MMPQIRNVPARWSVFGRRLQELRKANRMSQSELAREFDLTDVQVSRIENGKSGTTYETACAMETRLGARSGELVGIAFPSGQEFPLTGDERELLAAMHRVPEIERPRFLSIVKATGQAFAASA